MKLGSLYGRARDRLGLTRKRLIKWRDILADLGPRDALFMYLREGLERDVVVRAGIDRTIARLDAMDAALSRLALDGDATRARLAHAESTSVRTEAITHELAAVRARGDMLLSILEHTLWTESARVTTQALVSVVLASRNRPSLVQEAVASVLAQTYPHWELVVVDDARPGETQIDPRWFDDPRVRVVRGRARGLSAARNEGLREATGQIVTYLDDDNFMFPGWLKAVALTFEAHPEVDFVYGARVLQRPYDQHPTFLLPTIQFEPFERARLERGNFIDTGVIAHRAGLPGIEFDESLPSVEDWDLALKLTREKDAHALPVFASAYRMTAPARLSTDQQTMYDAAQRVFASHLGTGLPRVQVSASTPS